MKNSWSIVLVAIIALVIGGLFSKPQQTEASKPMTSHSDAVSGLNEIENRLTLLAANLEKQQSTKFEQAAVDDVAEGFKSAVDDYATKVDSYATKVNQYAAKFDEYVDRFDEYATKRELSELRAELMAEIESRIPMPIVEAVKSAPVKAGSVPSNYRARWTYPSTIEDHMAADHGVSTSGKTKAQLLAEHDAIHDKIGPVHSARSATVSRSRATYSSCPGGVCPTPQSSYPTSRFRVFRR